MLCYCFQCFLSMKVRQVICSFLTPLLVFLRTENTTVILRFSGLCLVSMRKERKLTLTHVSSASSLYLISVPQYSKIVLGCMSFLSQSADTLVKIQVKKIPNILASSVMLVTLTLQQEVDKIFSLLSLMDLQNFFFFGGGSLFLQELCALCVFLANTIL